jgi:hypothetical protein
LVLVENKGRPVIVISKTENLDLIAVFYNEFLFYPAQFELQNRNSGNNFSAKSGFNKLDLTPDYE